VDLRREQRVCRFASQHAVVLLLHQVGVGDESAPVDEKTIDVGVFGRATDQSAVEPSMGEVKLAAQFADRQHVFDGGNGGDDAIAIGAGDAIADLIAIPADRF